MSNDSFAQFGLPTSILRVLDDAGITTPTPIQLATLPDSLAGRDLLGRGRTGSGKTYAFSIPLVTRLAAGRPARPGHPRGLVLAPTRELVTQIMQTLRPMTDAAGLRVTTIFGGVGQNPQVSALRGGVDIVVACPGRLEDLIKQGHVSLDAIEITVLDEADHMADLGFLPAVTRLLSATPTGGQRMLFSATLDKAIDTLVRRFLNRPATHEADSVEGTPVQMTHHLLHVAKDQHLAILADLTAGPGRTVVFTRTKYGAKALARRLNKAGVPAVELHGNLGQNARTRNLAAFHAGEAQTLVATDVAARGIHVDDVALVIHADPPAEHKAYLHRSGRTARAGAEGTVVTLVLPDQVRDVNSLTRAAGIRPKVTRIAGADHPVLQELVPGERTLVPGGYVPAPPAAANPAPKDEAAGEGRRRRRPGRGRRGGGSGENSGGQQAGRSRQPQANGGSRAQAGGNRQPQAAGNRQPQAGGQRQARSTGGRGGRTGSTQSAGRSAGAGRGNRRAN
ncbi:DEAD/DEAH box helicase [Millisia brevis]|uniref:DEAD/DEAH box helicase n=1 Tax=Millisia brevis TaxID=264148 RepID=UPI000B1DAE3E|nr:DEAD/DEAH box helicase [Millisia brevis]